MQAQSDSTVYESVQLGYRYHFFDDQLSDWHDVIVGMKFQKKRWVLLPAITLAQRFDKQSWYLEGDSYKTLKNGDYLNLGVGFSPGKIFVQNQLYAEYYNPFKKWEHSLGLRWMRFSETGNVAVVTSSLSKYYGSMLTSIRINGAYGLDGVGFSNYTAILNHRYYLTDIQYVGLRSSYGFDNTLLLFSDLSNRDVSDAHQFTLGIEYKTDRKKRKEWKIAYDWTHYDFGDRNRNQHTISFFFTINDRYE